MRKSIHAALFSATFLTAIAATVPAHAAATAVPGNVAAWTVNASKTGSAPASQKVMITIHLKLRNTDQLKSFVKDVSNPRSPNYGKYLTPDAFRASYAPAAADVAAVKSFLTGQGFKIVDESVSGTFVAAEGTVAQVKSALGVNQDLFKFNGKIVRANSVAPALPASIATAVSGITGLNEAADTKHPTYLRATAGTPRAARRLTTSTITPPPVAANLPGQFCDTDWGDKTVDVSVKPAPFSGKLPYMVCGYTPQQVTKAYGATSTKYDGTGVTVAITDAYASPTMFADANAYAVNHSLPPLTAANYKEVIPKGIYGVDPGEPCDPQGWWGEESLDVAAVHGLAPGAKILYVGARDCGNSLDNALFKTIDSAVASVITNSWSFSGEALPVAYFGIFDDAFMQAASLGVSVLFSSGDNGDLLVDGIASASLPASSPFATSVGGTSLAVKAKGAKGEWGWGTSRNALSGVVLSDDGSTLTNTGGSTYSFTFGAGGGPSMVELQPDYQAGVVPDNLSLLGYGLSGGNLQTIYFGTPHRMVPDVSMVADPYTGYLVGQSFTIAGDPIADAGCTPTGDTTEYCEISFGGTSLASPLLAAVLARANQARAAMSQAPVGFINPLFYSLPVGSIGTGAPILDVDAPKTPTAVVRSYMGNPNRGRIIAINAFPYGTSKAKAGLGADSYTLTTTAGYDNVTGIGVPNIGALVKAVTMPITTTTKK